MAACGGDDKPGSRSTPTTASATTPTNAEQYAEATDVYRRWLALTDQTTVKKGATLPPSATQLATPKAIESANDSNREFWAPREQPAFTIVRATLTTTLLGTTGKEVRYAAEGPDSNTLALQVCMKSDGHSYNKAGKDLRVQANNFSGIVTFRTSDDGRTWKVDDQSNIKEGSKCTATAP
ncbi:hypothetical protein VV01_21825 [Luteipulveratus halotolerans]|uniref:Uncharacterized protein n=1 Tax=Luteipulveratus halotolerans TaxID=1631356 RepID=A0A0L6CDK7_9MICO|nr:hypothetical protein VV01_21825 [Luteipulveratus halotolerans]